MNKNYRYLYLICAAVMMLFAGILYAWSILKTPYLSEFGWNQGALGFNFTVTMSCFCIGGILGGVLIKKLPLWLIINLSAGMVCAGFWISGSLQGDSVWKLYLSYGVLCGLGIGIIYNIVISTIMGWFPDKRATVSGVLMMGFGASGLLFGFIADSLMDALGWRNVFHGLGICILAVFAICSCILRAPASVPVKSTASVTAEKTDYTTLEMLRCAPFWRFYLFTILLTSIGSCIISLAKDIALSIGVGEITAVALTGTLSLCNGFGRILSGALFDKIGSAKTIRTAGLISVSATMIMLIAIMTEQPVVLVFGIVFVGISYGCMPPISSGFIGKAYGSGNFPMNFSVANTMVFFASFSAAIGGWIYGFTGSYKAVLLLLALFSVIGSVMGESLRKIE